MADTLGVKKTTIYHYVRSKEVLLVDIYETMLDLIEARLRPISRASEARTGAALAVNGAGSAICLIRRAGSFRGPNFSIASTPPCFGGVAQY